MEFQFHIDYVSGLLKKPECFLNGDEYVSEQIKSHIKTIYDFTKNQEIQGKNVNALPELIINNFDFEQIWQQLELQNDVVLTRSLVNVSKVLTNKTQLRFVENTDMSSDIGEPDLGDLEEAEEEKGQHIPDESESDSESGNDLEIDRLEVNDDIENDVRNTKQSIVDDEFFKLHEMEQFLSAEEKKEGVSTLNSNVEESESENENDEIDMFQDDLDEDEDDDKFKHIKYKEFFVKTDVESKQHRNKFLEELPDSDEDDQGQIAKNVKSTLELKQERLQKRIAEIEGKQIEEKSWQLKGEITAENRPQNSLLQEIVEFDMTTRPAPVITESTSYQLEDVIKQRIKDRVFDSVVRKAKPVDTPLEYKKKLVLNQEKSKESLAQIYEKDYLNQQAALDPENDDAEEEEPEAHKEIKKMMSTLFNQLDALSNFHFTPKPAIPELKVISNLPAITIEEVAPVSMTNAALLAPEEIKVKSKGDIIGKSELTATDKKRGRRNKKQKQKQRSNEKSNKIGLGNKYTKDKSKKLLDKLSKDGNIEKMDENVSVKSVKSSSAFFSQLQDEAQSAIKMKTKIKRSKNSFKPDAKRMKLKKF